LNRNILPVENEGTIFERTILPHLDAAYNLARWLTGNDHDACDMVQESCLRALKFFGNFRGGDARAWLLTIVRNTTYTSLRRNRVTFETDNEMDKFEDPSPSQAQLLERAAKIDLVRAAIAQLAPEFREAVVLRDMEDFSYKEIAEIAGVPIGTVMSRLARARRQLQIILSENKNVSGGFAS
jgi:RNA polymerase sigma-70 factor (ECF subfamily)